MTTDECILYDQMVEWGIATADEMNLVRNVLDGSWEDILKKICYARTGYEDLNEFLQSEIFSKDKMIMMKMMQRTRSPLFFVQF